ncbi:glycosyltransferase [Candidatus Falkowbacteria bacterium]|nr:glycosyltransferase [Candidatus Falkowbacteria bacterium]
MRKIKIIHIITGLPFGGAETMLFDLARRLSADNFEVKVATAVRGGPLVQDFKEAGIEVRIFEKRGKIGLGLIFKLWRFLRREKPDIVHTHLFGGDTWGRIAAVLARVPIIISTEHNTNLDEGWAKRKLKKFLSHFTKKIVAVSEAVKNYSVVYDKIRAKKIVVVQNGIDLEKFISSSEKDFGDPPIIGVVGRLEEQKGYKYLFEALNLIKTIPWILWVVGDGSKKSELERLAKDLNLRERIIFLGARRNIAEILNQIDIFVLPSLWEGLGIAVLEAAAAGKPIVASRVGGIPEIIEEDRTGILVEPKNVKSLADGLEHILLGSAEAKEMGARARAMAEEKFGVEKMVGSYENLYKELVNKKIT